MIILHLSGGLGNQMFQYAFGRAIAAKLGADLKLELTDRTLNIHNGYELERIFNIKASQAMEADIQAILGVYRHKLIRKAFKVMGLNKIFKPPCVEEPYFHFSPSMLSISDNSYINGYWQSEKYFLDIQDEIRSEFAFKLPMSQQNADVADAISKKNSISLHVRRNDFANNSRVNSVHGLCSLDYYKAAISYMIERVKCPSFYVFSDDSTWVKTNLKIDYPCEFVEHNRGQESYNDMRLMSLCHHNIIANSSFSWWGAWLNNNDAKIVITPQKWFQVSKDVADLIPSAWIKM